MKTQSLLWFAGLMLLSSMVAAQIYKTVDKDGRVIYSDSPKNDNAEPVHLRSINTVAGETRHQPAPEQRQSQPQEAVAYEIEIVSPRDKAFVPVSQRDLPVAVRLNKPLEEGDLLVYFLDDEMIEETTNSNILISNPWRGVRVVRVEVINTHGQLLGTSAPVSVSLMRPPVRNPAPR